MSHYWDKWGKMYPVTVLHIDRSQVVDVKTMEKDGYSSVLVGHGEYNLRYIPRRQIGIFLKHDLPPKRHLKEFRVTPDCLLPIGYMVGVRHFTPGMYYTISNILSLRRNRIFAFIKQKRYFDFTRICPTTSFRSDHRHILYK